MTFDEIFTIANRVADHYGFLMDRPRPELDTEGGRGELPEPMAAATCGGVVLEPAPLVLRPEVLHGSDRFSTAAA